MKKNFRLNPTQVLLLGFVIAILLGAILLYLPIFHEPNVNITFTDALFTATSAITVTGLNVIDPGSTFNRGGEIILIILIQIGGLGFMTFAIWFFVLLGKKISLKQRLLMKENIGQMSLEGIVKLALRLLWITMSVELIGALLLALGWHGTLGWKEAIYQGIFHSVSAFNNAGFSLFPDSLMSSISNPLVNIVVIFLIILGGIGFVVIIDVINKGFVFKKLSLHSKVTLTTNLVLIMLGLFFFFLMEFNNQNSIGTLTIGDKLLATSFQVIATRTAGFNTLDIAGLTQATLFFFIIYMFIGASSGSTGGGVKVTSIAVIWVTIKSVLQGKEHATIYKKTIPNELILRTMAVIILSLSVVIAAALVLDITEPGTPFLTILFEATSAFGTVGLSMGLTPNLSDAGRWVIMITMLIGRLGPLTFGFALANRKTKEHFKYPEEKIMIG